MRYIAFSEKTAEGSEYPYRTIVMEAETEENTSDFHLPPIVDIYEFSEDSTEWADDRTREWLYLEIR